MIHSVEDIAKIEEAESKMMKRWKTPNYCCKYCDQQVLSVLSLHLRKYVNLFFFKNLKSNFFSSSHKINMRETEVLDHFYPDVDSPMKLPPYAVKL